ncbi:F-box protein [Raphanus sativus]|uniref:F-box protein At1g69090-like n=1 Tax=Raphanus sativus TaxID=3726 RepID=A0A9W3DHT4_RAPSA|nr:F-box protein At1g69090-like [Raphanus sativus]KAJ4899779.1 F-box protein [Raphanus sativus]
MASQPLALAQSPPKSHCWSELPLDLMQLILERLGFADFERAKSVCSSWGSASRKSKPNNKIPWMILFPEEKNYCLLFNPEDKEEKLYKTQHLADDFTEIHCLATCRSWLLMDPSLKNKENPVYILNLLTRERINLPPIWDQRFDSPILWIDEKTKDYLVIGDTLLYLKKGDKSWKQISEGIQDDMVFKDHKLYCLADDELRIFDFSGEFPLQVSRVSVGGGRVQPKILSCRRMRLPDIPDHIQEVRTRENVVVTVRGDVLIVKSESPFLSETWNFKIFKMDSSNGLEEIFSLGDEAIILDLGITVLAKDQDGITSNSIYFTGDEIGWYECDTEIFVFNLDSKKAEQLPPLVSSSVSFSRARWFLPSFRND